MSNIKCLRCNNEGSSVAVIGNSIFCSCGWHGQLDPEIEKRRERRKKIKLYAVMLCSAVFLGYVGVLYKRWGDYMGTYFFTHAKSLVGLDQPVDWENMGELCEVLRRWECMEISFKEVLKTIPDQAYAIEGVGLAQVNQKQYQAAVASFEELLNRGESSPRIMYGYGKAIAGLGKHEESKTWYYRVLKMYPSFIDVTEELVNTLVREGSYMEALSVIGNMSALYPQAVSYFKARVMAINDMAEKKSGQTSEKIVRLSAIDDHHFLPIRLSGMVSPAMFLVDTGATNLVVNYEILRDNNVRNYRSLGRTKMYLANGAAIAGEKILIEKINIGPFELENVDARVCDQCELLAGKSVLKRFQVSSHTKNGVEYLDLKR